MAKKKRKNRRKQQIQLRLVLLGLVLLAALCGAVFFINRRTPSKKHMDPSEYFGLSGDEAAVIVDGSVSEKKGFVIDGTACAAYETVTSKVSGSIYYSEPDSEIITTTPTEKVVYPISDGHTEEGEVLSRDGALYVTPSFISRYSDSYIEEFSDPARLVIRTEETRETETAARDTVIRYRAGIKSPIIRDLMEGETVDVLDVHADGSSDERKVDGWTCVSTSDGYTGYVEDRYLDGQVSETEVPLSDALGEYTTVQLDTKVNMVFHQTTDEAANSAVSSSLEGVTGVNVIAPTWFFLNDTDGGIESIASSDYVETAHEAGLKVWAVFNDFDGNVSSSEATAEALSTDAKRSAVVSTVMAALSECGADGLNIDFEKVSESAAPAFLEMVREFSIECRKAAITLSVDNYPPTFTAYMNRAEQARVCDYIVVMCYDEHTNSSDEPGSVSSIGYVREGIEATAAQATPEKTVAALPFYTRLWEIESDGSFTGSAYGMEDAHRAVDSLGMTTSWDEATGQNYGELKSGEITYRIWLEDAESLRAKMQEVAASGCAGIAEWKLGLQTDDVWQVLEDGLAE